MFVLSYKKVMFITALDLGGGLGEHRALASIRTDGWEKKKKLFVKIKFYTVSVLKHNLGQLQGL